MISSIHVPSSSLYTSLVSDITSLLRQTKNAVMSGTCTQVVVGNSTGDLDSLACVLVLASLKGIGACMPIPRVQLSWRKDVMAVCTALNIDLNVLLCKEEIEQLGSSVEQLQLTLVDHQRVEPPFLQDKVTQVIDHHVDEQIVGHAEKIIKTTTSCATIVANEFLLPAGRTIDKDALKLLSAAIHKDMSEKGGEYVTCIDLTTHQRLQQAIGHLGIDERDLCQLGRDVADLSRSQILHRDCKMYPLRGRGVYCVASVPCSIDSQWFSDIEALRQEKGALFAFAFGTQRSGERLLCVMGEANMHLLTNLTSLFGVPNHGIWHTSIQSRKELAPILASILG